MDSDHWLLIQKLFHDVTDLPEDEWISYLNNQPALDPQVKNEVLKLLNAELNTTSDVNQIQQNISGLLAEINLPVIDDYEVSERIAVGGMGSIYKAWDSRLSRHVAIKFLHPHRSQQMKAKQRFLREARSSAKIRHENICPVFEVSETPDEILYIVSAFCEGVDLSKKIRSNALNLEQILSIFEQLLSALSSAHAQGIVHRDLKPENIIVDDIVANNVADNSVADNYKIQLVDFGIARSITSDADDYQTGTGEILGTPDYMSPEQFRGEAFDHLSDIWSCGIILYEMLEGRTPYQGKTAPEIIYSMLHESIPFTAEDDQSVSPLYGIIRKCLQIDKSLRPASVDSLLVMLADARTQLLEKDSLESKPTYVRGKNDGNDELLNSLSTQRKIVSLKLKTLGQVIDKEIIDALESNCLKYRGLVSEKKYSKQSQSFQIRAFFGYPVADELTIKNAINCGLGWESILSEAGLEYFMLAGFEKVIEKEKTFVTDPTLQGEEWMTDVFLGQIHKPGFWLMNPLSKGLRDNLRDDLVKVQDSLQLSTNETEVICHLIKPVVFKEEKSAQLNLSHFIGRDSQLSFLLENWEQAVEGDQQRILISGEAGIGKSRLIYEFKKRVESYPDLNLIELDCSPYEKASTYYPILQFLRRRIGKAESQRKEGVLNYLENLLENRLENSSDIDKQLFCKLMGIELDLEEQANLPTGDLLSRRYQDLLIRILTAKSEGQTSLLIIEDLHWADAATGVIIEKLLQPSSINQSMILMSSRPEYKPVWLSNIVTSNLYLSKLRQSQSEALLKDLVKDLSAGKDKNSINKLLEMVPQLVERTGGNPLFIEEIAKTFDAFSDMATSSQLAIPETIQDTLIARLERLGVAQYMAQLASVIGRDFNLELLKRCQNESEAEFKQQLHTLVQADILHSLDNENSYRFKHALIRDAAYQMLVPESCKELHKVIAKTLEKEFPESVKSQPELLAQHWEASESISFAVKYWLLAAQRNLQLSSITECMDQCDHVIQLFESDSKHDTDQSQLLMAYMIKGPALMFRRGYADERMREAYSRALELIEKTNNKELEFPALFGLWTYHCVKAQHESAAKLAQKMVTLSANLSPFEKCEAHMVTGITQYYRGQFEPAQKELSIAFENYDEQQAKQHILTFGQDPGVVIQSYQAWNESMLGNMQKASAFSDLAVENAHKLKHPFTLTYALSFSCWFKLNSGQIEEADLLINESIDVCEKNEIAVFLGLSLSLKALVLFSKGEVEEGTAVMTEAEKIYLGTGATLFVPGFMTIKAEVSLVLQDIETAEQLLDQALAIIDNSDENWSLAMTLALKSVVCASRGQEDKEEALLQKASKVLTEQNALGLRKLMEEERGFYFD